MKYFARNFSKFSILAGVFFAIFLFAYHAKASDPPADHIVINEIYAVPTSLSTEYDWIELYNPTSLDVNLSNYFLIDDEVSSKPFYLSGTLKSGEYLVFEGKTGGFTFDLSSTTEEVFLKTKVESIETPVNDVKYSQTFRDGTSFSRIPNGNDTGYNEDDFRFLKSSLGEENRLPEYSNQVYINELLPQPATSSSDEYIELYNSGDNPIDLIGWQLDAGTFVANTIIAPHSYQTFKNPEVKIRLTDTGDTTNLIDPNGDIKSTVTYGESRRGQSYSLFDSDWKWTTTLTPNVANILTEEVILAEENNQIISTDINGAKNLADEEIVQISGTVTVAPGTFSASYFYIQDGSAGIQIYNYDKLFPSISVGDIVQVTGELDTYFNERRVKTSLISDIQIIGNHSPPEPEKITIADLSENFEGKYIQVVGTVTKTSGSVFYIHGSGEYQVSIKSGTNINKPRMKVGDRVLISGIFSQSGDTYRILPTAQNDVKILSSGKLANSGPDLVVTIFISLILFGLWTLLVKRKAILKN